MFLLFVYLFCFFDVPLSRGDKVCGTDFNTYESPEELWKLQDAGVKIAVAGLGDCDEACASKDLVCASDNETYFNMCHLVIAARYNHNIVPKYPGPC